LHTNTYEMYAHLKKHSPDISINMIYAIIDAQEDAQEDTHGQVIAKIRKVEILMRLDDMDLAPK